MTTQSFEGHIALVTGGTTGLGAGAAKHLIKQVATVSFNG